MTAPPPNRRSALFLPALSPERIAGAAAAGADLCVLDLEDGTAPGRRAEARDGLRALFSDRDARPGIRRYLRINAPGSADFVRDLAALLDWPAAPDGLVIPKAESAEAVAWVRGAVAAVHPGLDLIAIVETPKGLDNASAIAAAPGCGMLLLGCDDLTAALGGERSWEALAYSRGRVLAAAGIEAMDGPWRDADDRAGLIEEARRVAAMGYAGKVSYHADQVPAIHAAFTPAPEAVREAERVLEAARASSGDATLLDGRIVNAAIVKQAERLLARARRRGLL